MTERGAASLRQDEHTLTIGPSRVRWENDALCFDIDERGVPLPFPIRGTVRVMPRALTHFSAALDATGRHIWQPIAPSARIEVNLDAPALRWSGEAYIDSNRGSEPLESRLREWHWSRGQARGETFVLYDVTGLNEQDSASLAVAFDEHGNTRPFASPAPVTLPRSGWRIARNTRSENPGAAAIERSFEDTPFYARSVVRHEVEGQTLASVHESLDLRRFASPIVQAMLPFRMPRRTVPARGD